MQGETFLPNNKVACIFATPVRQILQPLVALMKDSCQIPAARRHSIPIYLEDL